MQKSDKCNQGHHSGKLYIPHVRDKVKMGNLVEVNKDDYGYLRSKWDQNQIELFNFYLTSIQSDKITTRNSNYSNRNAGFSTRSGLT